jgi:natural product biosynthesis luciferase-like monooxygenase protein
MSLLPIQHPDGRGSSLIDVLEQRANQQPDQQAYTFLADGEHETATLTYSELMDRSRTLAAHLQLLGATGERVLLLYPPGLEYIIAFFGCLYARALAVPAYPPSRHRPTPRLAAIVEDAQPGFILTTEVMRQQADRICQVAPYLSALRWITNDDACEAQSAGWARPTIDRTDYAFLQYTSGSTSRPKGAIVSHNNLIQNLALIQQQFGHTGESRGVIWLPPYHDMGLIGGILQPLYVGFPVVLMPPLAFMQHPLKWLQAISRYKATSSGGPNFAYDLCSTRITPEQCSTLDLSSWKIAFNGAEPVRNGTLDRFSAAFAPAGFRREAFYPCYGLAEATLLVSGGKVDVEPRRCVVDSSALQEHQIRPVYDDQQKSQVLVSCGSPAANHSVHIVDPETRRLCQPGEIGEVWINGPCIIQAYWSSTAEAAADTLRATLANDDDTPYLRTGDLGFLYHDELFITGRRKELIIIRGRNYYPQDIEHAAAASHPALRPDGGAAFSVLINEQEHLVVVHEVLRSRRGQVSAEISSAIRQVVAVSCEIQVHIVVLIPEGTLPRTSSGKIQRLACRDQYLFGELRVIYADNDGAMAPAKNTPPDNAASVWKHGLLSQHQNSALLLSYLQQQLAAALHIDPARINPALPLDQLGLDSLGAVSLQHMLATDLGCQVEVSSFLERISLETFAHNLLAQSRHGAPISLLTPDTSQSPEPHFPLSYGQRAMWFLHQLTPVSAAYNIYSAVRLEHELDPDLLRSALHIILERHPILRCKIVVHEEGEPVQQSAATFAFFEHADVADWSNQNLEQHLSELAYQPFDLEHGPLLRLYHWRRHPSESILLLVVHHIVADFWSLAILARDLVACYQELQSLGSVRPASPSYRYQDFIHWQRSYLEGSQAADDWAYWQEQLAGAPFVLDLPADRPRPPVQTYVGASEHLCIGEPLTRQLQSLSQSGGATMYMLLMAAFQTLLFRYTQQADILIGSPVAGRTRSEFADVVGYFVNPLLIRTRFTGDPLFTDIVQQVRQTVIEALRHQDFPFALLAERLQPKRDPSRTPIFQVMFIYQQTPLWMDSHFAGLALSGRNNVASVGGLTLESIPLAEQPAQFDMTLVAVETRQGMEFSLLYNRDIFDATTAQSMLVHLQQLLKSIAENPERRISHLPIMTSDETRRLSEWNDSTRQYGTGQCLHHMFESRVQQSLHDQALIFDEHVVTYAELNHRANQLAGYLRSVGIGPDTTVGILLERSIEMVVALLGVLKAGGAYLPIDLAMPNDRLGDILDDARPRVVITQRQLLPRLIETDIPRLCIDDLKAVLDRLPGEDLTDVPVCPENLAYVIFTSGSTGKPKGVMIEHRNVVNFCHAIQDRLACGPGDTCLAVTNLSFDISVLELLVMLCSGSRIVLLSEQAILGDQRRGARPRKPLDFSLFYFANDSESEGQDKYRLLREGALFADNHDFTAIWTPERHFHPFGGLYPNPALTSAALAVITRTIAIRAGSVVLPLHHPIRVAEEWAVVDNLSQGRVGIAFASGWHADDFALYPEHYAGRKELTWRGIEQVQQLWRGESLTVQGGSGGDIEVRVFPRPIQSELPIWLTAAGTIETFQKAGEYGLNVLTHLLGQDLESLAEKIHVYRNARARVGYAAEEGTVTLMLHTFVGEDLDHVRETVSQPFKNYLRSSVGLIASLVQSLNLPLDLATMSESDMAGLLDYAFDRYFQTSALFGTIDSCQDLLDRLRTIGVNEVACLIDFGVETDVVLHHLEFLNQLKEREQHSVPALSASLTEQARRYNPTLMQCTPSLMQLLRSEPDTMEALGSLRTLLLGGETLPAPLATDLVQRGFKLINMYGPTETTVWSTSYDIPAETSTVSIGRPLANNRVYILDPQMHQVPTGVPGELYIGGFGVARGYLNRPGLTATYFVPDPYSRNPGERLYRTGDYARWGYDGQLEFLGRRDHQVKVRGMRIELGEIETALLHHPAIQSAVVCFQSTDSFDQHLVAYITRAAADRHARLTAEGSAALSATVLREFLKNRIPEYMIPSEFILLESLPLLPSGKVNRKVLGALRGERLDVNTGYIAPASDLERLVVEIWQQALKCERIGIQDNFFDLGGNSLLMVQVHNQLVAHFPQAVLPLVKLFEYPTIAALTLYLSSEVPLTAPDYAQSEDRARLQRDAQRRQRTRVLGSKR